MLAGFPRTALDAVRERLKVRFPSYVIRGVAATTRHNHLCLYDSGEITKVLDQAADAVFGSSKRPMGFCRNEQRGCQKKPRGKCDLASHQACTKTMPDRLFLLYQEGEREEDLFRKFSHAPLPLCVPKELYAKPRQAADFCEDAIEQLNRRAGLIAGQLRAGSALLLPPKAFGRSSAVKLMLDRVARGSDPTSELRAFRQDFYDKATRKFVGRSDLGFMPGQAAGLHGTPNDQTDAAIALTRRYRLGCTYRGDFHWDVSPMDGSDLNGRHRFETRDNGVLSPKGKNANVLVDDCLR